MRLHSDSFPNRGPIPAQFAFGRAGDGDRPIELAGNRNPQLAWDEVPAATASFVLLCIDPDVPTVRELVNRTDAVVPADQPRTDFIHWVMVDIPADQRAIAAGSCADGVTAHGKQSPPGPAGSRQGINGFTGFFADDPDMRGDYRGYDGPCPPFNDQRVHRYFFRLFALDCARLDLPERFGAAEVFTAMHGHLLAEAAIHGTYTTNRALA